MKRLILILLSCMFVSQAFCAGNETQNKPVSPVSTGLKVGAATACAGALLSIHHELKYYGGMRGLVEEPLSVAVSIGAVGFVAGCTYRIVRNFCSGSI